MHKYIELDGDLLVFKNTDELAGDINQIISKLREFSSQIPLIGEKAGNYIKKKTPGPRMVKRGVSMTLKGNAFNYKTRRFQAAKRTALVSRTINYFVNKRLRVVESSATASLKEKVEGVTADYISMYILKQLEQVRIPSNVKSYAATHISLALSNAIMEQV